MEITYLPKLAGNQAPEILLPFFHYIEIAGIFHILGFRDCLPMMLPAKPS